MGTGVGLVIRGGGVIDGAEVIAVFTGRKTGFSNSEIIMLINTMIFAVAAFKLGIETAMYSIITYFTASRATNYVVDGIEEFTAMNIICSMPEEVKSLLVNDLGKGITVYKGERGYLPGSFEVPYRKRHYCYHCYPAGNKTNSGSHNRNRSQSVYLCAKY